MKSSTFLPLVVFSLFATPALAVDVVNLDSVPHRVLFESAGSKQVQTINAGDTGYFVGQSGGFISLLSAKDPKPSKGTLHADGILSGIVGAERTEGIPVDPMDQLAIWDDGTIGIQQRRADRGRF